MFQEGGQTDGRTDMTKLIVAFCSFAKMPKTHTHTYAHTCTYAHTHKHSTRTRTHIHTHTHMHIRAPALTHTHIHIHTHTRTHMHTHTHIHTHIHKHTHTHNIPLRRYGLICLHLSYIVIYQPQLFLLLCLIVTIIITTLCYLCSIKDRTRSFLLFFSNNLY